MNTLLTYFRVKLLFRSRMTVNTCIASITKGTVLPLITRSNNRTRSTTIQEFIRSSSFIFSIVVKRT
ncbi:unnamed protein product [Schistosoma mattheei]|uniref:Uncharacterized protein n=1 Tax=Schistosoma mattheei TaxID=31246 RepID=A0A183PUN8_9TREM|nr:unnamed protein product [Schistosoma mattheei]